jgi:hypothetical protein
MYHAEKPVSYRRRQIGGKLTKVESAGNTKSAPYCAIFEELV